MGKLKVLIIIFSILSINLQASSWFGVFGEESNPLTKASPWEAIPDEGVEEFALLRWSPNVALSLAGAGAGKLLDMAFKPKNPIVKSGFYLVPTLTGYFLGDSWGKAIIESEKKELYEKAQKENSK